MKKSEVKIGQTYTAKVSDKVVPVRIDGANRQGGWNATNLATNKKVRIKSAQRLRGKSTASGAPLYSTEDGAKPDATPTKRGRRTKDTPAGDGLTAFRNQRAVDKAQEAADKPKRTSAIDAAAQVLARAKGPMTAKAMIEAMAEQGLWTSPGGRTPHATLYSAIIREIAGKGGEARFRKVNRGQFEANA